LAAFFEIGEIVFDRAEVRRVRRQEQKSVRGGGDDLESAFCFMKGRVIEHDDGGLVQDGKKVSGQPLIKPVGIGGSFEQNRGDEFSAAFGGDQAGARTFVA
jgi:hypothetical protein